MTDISPETIAAINRHLLVRTPLRPAKLCFVFGTRQGDRAFAAELGRLWRAGLFEWVLISGGPTQDDPEPEATALRRMSIAEGVPAETILVETGATNSGENVTLSLPIIEREIGLGAIEAVIAVGKFATSRRYLMTLELHWPEVRKMLAPVNYHPVHPGRWQDDPDLRGRVLAEWAKLEPYKARGLIAELRAETCDLLGPDDAAA